MSNLYTQQPASRFIYHSLTIRRLMIMGFTPARVSRANSSSDIQAFLSSLMNLGHGVLEEEVATDREEIVDEL